MGLKRTVVLTGIMLLAARSSLLAAEALAYKAAPLGTGVSEFLRLNPEFQCPNKRGVIFECQSRHSTYADFKAKQVSATFLEGKLSMVEIVIFEGPKGESLTGSASVIEHAIASRFGEPRKEERTIGSVAEKISLWKSNEGEMQLSQGSNETIQFLSIMISCKDHWQRSVELRRQSAKGDI